MRSALMACDAVWAASMPLRRTIRVGVVANGGGDLDRLSYPHIPGHPHECNWDTSPTTSWVSDLPAQGCWQGAQILCYRRYCMSFSFW